MNDPKIKLFILCFISNKIDKRAEIIRKIDHIFMAKISQSVYHSIFNFLIEKKYIFKFYDKGICYKISPTGDIFLLENLNKEKNKMAILLDLSENGTI